jgi:hypothetical protein
MHEDRTDAPAAPSASLHDVLADWAMSVCEPAEIQPDPRAEWALEVTAL